MGKTFLILMAASLFLSCNKNASEPIGYQDNTIKLSADKLSFTASSASKEVLTEGSQWKLFLITNEDVTLDYSVNDLQITTGDIAHYENTPMKIEGDWFTVTRELKKVTVDVKQNNTNKKRILKIGVNDRNYFDRIVVEQSGE